MLSGDSVETQQSVGHGALDDLKWFKEHTTGKRVVSDNAISGWEYI